MVGEERMRILIKEGLKRKAEGVRVAKTTQCPDEATLTKYLEGDLLKEKERAISEHVTNCFWCLEQLDLAQRARSAPPCAKNLSMTDISGWIKKNKWLLAAAITFTLSFVISRYFLQLLTLTLLMGMKWIFSTGGAKTVVMIYDSLKRRSSKNDGSRLNQGL